MSSKLFFSSSFQVFYHFLDIHQMCCYLLINIHNSLIQNPWNYIIIIIIMILELHTEQVLDQLLNVLRFCVNKTAQTGRTFRRILAEYKMVISAIPLFFVSISISLNCCFNFIGVVPNTPSITEITYTDISLSLFRS